MPPVIKCRMQNAKCRIEEIFVALMQQKFHLV